MALGYVSAPPRTAEVVSSLYGMGGEIPHPPGQGSILDPHHPVQTDQDQWVMVSLPREGACITRKVKGRHSTCIVLGRLTRTFRLFPGPGFGSMIKVYRGRPGRTERKPHEYV